MVNICFINIYYESLSREGKNLFIVFHKKKTKSVLDIVTEKLSKRYSKPGLNILLAEDLRFLVCLNNSYNNPFISSYCVTHAY